MTTKVLSVTTYHKLDLTTIADNTVIKNVCSCQELISSTYHCNDCGRYTFESIQSFENHDIKQQWTSFVAQKDHTQQQLKELDAKKLQLEATTKQKKAQLVATVDSIASLEHDINTLKRKTKEEASQIKDMQQSQEVVKKELEDLSEKLFHEADSMISTEKSQQKILQQRNNQLSSDLQSTQCRLQETQQQLQSLKSELNRSDDDKEPLLENTLDIHIRAQLDTISMHGFDLGRLYMDTLESDSALMDFNDFIQASQHTSLRQLHHLKYMKYCLRDDISPCLRFGPNPRFSSKKIMDAILVKSCFVELCPKDMIQQGTAVGVPLWERFTSPFLGCQACGRKIKDASARQELLRYRFRISYFDEWTLIDRFCRDRLMSVIEFYHFIQQLRAGVYKHRSLHEVYQQFIRLKLQMFFARLGVLPNTLQSCGIDSNSIATPFHGEEKTSHSMILFSDSNITERISSSTDSSITISTVESASST